MPFFKILILAIVQGLAELLPVSSSAHVVVAEKLMGLDPTTPEMTLVLVMLHTGTMFSVIVYFWAQWKRAYFSSEDAFNRFVVRALWATILTAVIGYPLQKAIVHFLFHGRPKAQIEDLFGRLDLAGGAMFMVGLLILWAGFKERKTEPEAALEYERSASRTSGNVTMSQAGWMGAIQGLCLPLRGFSRSGSTISIGLLRGATREKAERFSFAMAVIITPIVIAREGMRLLEAVRSDGMSMVDLQNSVVAALVGMVFSFIAGLAALKWLSSWLENGRWYLFGLYCIGASMAIIYLARTGL